MDKEPTITVRSQSLQEITERFSLAMRGANDGLWDWDMSTGNVYYSPRWESMLGYAPDELEHTLGTWKRLVHQDDRDRALAAVQSLVEGRCDKFEVEFRMLHKDGSYRHILSRAFLSDTGGHKRLVGTHVDITERKNLEQRLLESEAQLKASQSVAKIGHYMLDILSGIWTSSEMLDNIFGIGPDYVRSVEGWAKLVHPDHRADMVEYFSKQVLLNRLPFDREYRIVRQSDGANRWVHGLGKVDYTPDGTPIMMFGTIQDITERKEAKLALIESEKKFRSIVNSSPLAMYFYRLHPNGKLILTGANPAADRTIGFSHQELVGKSIEEAFPNLVETDIPELYRKVATGELGQQKFEISYKDDRFEGVYEVHAYRTGSDNLSVNFRDITARKQADKELGQYRENLESLVKEQTEKLKQAHSELLQRERLATLGKLTAMVSHELRNPLGTIKTSLFSIADGLERNDPKSAVRPLELAERSIDRCVTIIEELNSYARDKEISPTATPFDDWLHEVVRAQSFPPEIRCELALASGITASVDQEKLRRVIVNLISNAVHALLEKDEQVKLLRITTRALDGWYEIGISDNGIGMSEETREQVFDPLFSTKNFGVGLGMVIVKNIIEQHHGEIRIDSTKEVGTTVTVRLPRDLTEEKNQSTIC